MNTRLAFLFLLILLPLGIFSSDASAQGKKDRPGKRDPSADAPVAIATLVTDDGRTRDDVEIKEEKFAAIKFKDRGRAEELAGERVVEVRYKGGPPQFSAGQSQYRAGLFDRAVQSFTASRNAATEGSWVWFHSTFWLGESQRQNGNAAEGVTELQRFLEKGADHWLAPAAIFGLGQAQIGAARHANAVVTFKRLETGFGDM